MEQYSLSITIGEGNIGHNSSVVRRKKLDNVDPNRTKLNINILHENIKSAYQTLFDDAVKKYNLTQKRSDRRIENYYKKICDSKKEKPFYEFVIQVGNMDIQPEMDVTNQIFTEFVECIQSKYPQIYIFGAYIHNDESTPHLHLDYIPYATYNKGMEKRVSLSKAMDQMGYSFKGSDDRNKGLYKAFRQDLLSDLEEICQKHDIIRQNMHNTNKHEPNVQAFKERVELEKEIVELDTSRKSLEREIVLLEEEHDSKGNQLDTIKNEIVLAEAELKSLENQIMENPIEQFTKDEQIKDIVSDIKSTFSVQKENFSQLKHDTLFLPDTMPEYKTDWLDRNVEYIEPKKDFFGREKEAGYYKISEEEWTLKHKELDSNTKTFNAVVQLYKDVKKKLHNMIDAYEVMKNEISSQIYYLRRKIDELVNLPVTQSWKKVLNTNSQIKELTDELDITRTLVSSREYCIKKAKEETAWYKKFYDIVLPILHVSKTNKELSSFDEVIKEYAEDDKIRIKKDLNKIVKKPFLVPNFKKRNPNIVLEKVIPSPSYKQIVFKNGEKGSGWYSSKEEGNVFLGKKSELNNLKKQYPDARFKDITIPIPHYEPDLGR